MQVSKPYRTKYICIASKIWNKRCAHYCVQHRDIETCKSVTNSRATCTFSCGPSYKSGQTVSHTIYRNLVETIDLNTTQINSRNIAYNNCAHHDML